SPASARPTYMVRAGPSWRFADKTMRYASEVVAKPSASRAASFCVCVPVYDFTRPGKDAFAANWAMNVGDPKPKRPEATAGTKATVTLKMSAIEFGSISVIVRGQPNVPTVIRADQATIRTATGR